mmetsp:Transcript_22576/g.80574  ORF Transcript_22576/g.80574 Transcript_22576/m.80574 type:complete len:312 (-) Transcript_22576:450-1385(-)
MFCWRSRGSALEASVQSWSDAIVIRAASAACRTAPCPSANFSKRGYKDLCSTCAKAPEPPPTRASAAARVKTRQSTVTNAALHSYVRGAERPTSPGGARAETQSSDDCGVDIFEPSRSSAETGPSFDGASSSCCGAVVGRRQARLARTSSAMYSAMTTNSSFCCCQVPLKTSSGTSAASYSSESCGFAAAQPKTSSTTANLARRSATTELLPLRDASARSAVSASSTQCVRAGRFRVPDAMNAIQTARLAASRVAVCESHFKCRRLDAAPHRAASAFRRRLAPSARRNGGASNGGSTDARSGIAPAPASTV